jgi:hypothetical protein
MTKLVVNFFGFRLTENRGPARDALFWVRECLLFGGMTLGAIGGIMAGVYYGSELQIGQTPVLLVVSLLGLGTLAFMLGYFHYWEVAKEELEKEGWKRD